MTTFAVVVTIIIAIIGVFKWKKTMESPIQTIERTGRKAWAEENSPAISSIDDDDCLATYSYMSVYYDDDD